MFTKKKTDKQELGEMVSSETETYVMRSIVYIRQIRMESSPEVVKG